MRGAAWRIGAAGALAFATLALGGCGGLSDDGPAYCVDGTDPDTGAALRLCTYKPSDSCVEALDPRIRRRPGSDPFQWICPPA